MLSRTCASISRACRAPVTSRKRSARVDLPWSMCAMTEKLRMKRWSMSRGRTLPLIERQQRLRVLRPDVISPGPDQAIVRVLLEAMRRPPRNAADREDRREQIDVDAERVVSRGRVEVDV